MKIPVYTAKDLGVKADEFRRPYQENYLAMYSSLWPGIVTDPLLMTVPVDDHLVHRADGVFDVARCVDGKVYCLKEHLDRLEKSAAGIDLNLPEDYERIWEIIRTAVRAGGEKNVLVRIMVSRGPGGFSAKPYEPPASQLYVVVHKPKPLPPEFYDEGVAIISTDIPVKPSFFAQIKSCDYLANVMIKKKAKDAGVEYAVTWDEHGFLAEGSTENILLVSPEKELLAPRFDRILKGITLTRIMELAQSLVEEGLLSRVANKDIDRASAEAAVEVMLCGTSIDVVPVRLWDDRVIGSGSPGPVARRLLELLRRDQQSNLDVLTPMFD
ncbi:MAG: aminotransferase class IV [Deltaproteobacteria bacterium]|nr:aminotransferase class IV [Deltaproteobacteria bacterium]